MIPPLPPYRRQDAAWGPQVIHEVVMQLAVVLAHEETAARRGERSISSVYQITQLASRAKAIVAELMRAPKGAHVVDIVQELDVIWTKAHYLAKQVPPTGIIQRRK